MNVLKTATMTVRYGGMRNRVRRAKTTAGLALALVCLLSMPSLVKSPPTRQEQLLAGDRSARDF